MMPPIPKIHKKVQVVIDARERQLIQLIQESDSVESPLNYEVRTLELGDILFEYAGKPLVLLERKTLSDLDTSIKDSRYREQKLRLIHSKIPRCCYLIEGILESGSMNSMGGMGTGDFSMRPGKYDLTPQDKNRLYSAMINTTIRDQIPVIRSHSLSETLYFIHKISQGLHKYGSSLGNEDENGMLYTHASVVKARKKDNLTPEHCYRAQLMQIPGVSATIAERIAQEYPQMRLLLHQLNSEDSKVSLSAIIDLRLPNGRRIGPAIGKRLLEYLN